MGAVSLETVATEPSELGAWCRALVVVVAAADCRPWESNQLHVLLQLLMGEPAPAGGFVPCGAPGEYAEADERRQECKSEERNAAEGSRGRLKRRSAAAAQACAIIP